MLHHISDQSSPNLISQSGEVVFSSSVTECVSESICVFRELNPDLAGIGVGLLALKTEMPAET